jgi:hypothetical protein
MDNNERVSFGVTIYVPYGTPHPFDDDRSAAEQMGDPGDSVQQNLHVRFLFVARNSQTYRRDGFQ